LFESQRGTLFLDEMAVALHRAKLLRVLQSVRCGMGEVVCGGSTFGSSRHQRQPRGMVAAGAFLDLFYRINVVEGGIPRCGRREDVRARLHFRAARARVLKSRGGRRVMTACSWPGNVRGLENEVERIAALTVRRKRSPPTFLGPDRDGAAEPCSTSPFSARRRSRP
jgi:transcriptional regulator with PAS, ATPase and Fis domain